MEHKIGKDIKKFSTFFGACIVIGVFVLLINCPDVFAEDWPTYMHDNTRSGVTSEELDHSTLRQSWVYTAPGPVRTAWAGPAPWDPLHGEELVPALRDFDSALFVSVVGDSVYVGSSVTDSVRCLEISSGKQKWFYRTNGPVRSPPSFYSNRLYFGSDDGYVYCLNTDGSFVWKYHPFSDDRLICSNGRLMPMWPVRTGTAVDDNKVYFASSLVTWRNSYLSCVNTSDGSQVYSRSGGTTPTGAILLSASKVYLTMGRGYPRVYNRSNGSYLGWFEAPGDLSGRNGVGGSYALLTTDSSFFYGRGRTWAVGGEEMKEHNAESRDHIASEAGARCIVVSGTTAYVLKDSSLKAVNRTNQSTIWNVSCDCPLSLIKVGNKLFAGGDGKVRAYSIANGNEVWNKTVTGRVFGLAASNGHLLASTDAGHIYAFGGIPGDFSGDGEMDIEDLFLFIGTYLKCTDPRDPNCQEYP